MPRLPALPSNQRLFGRIDSFTCECPRCGTVINARFDRSVSSVRRTQSKQLRPTSRQSRGGDGRRLTYNPLSSRLVCPSCRRTWGVGLLLYPVIKRALGRQPPDTRPTYRQILDIRRLAGGFLMPTPLHGSDEVNIAIEEPCTCAERGGPSQNCPVHGWTESEP